MKGNILFLDPDGDMGAAVLEAAAKTHRLVQFARTVRDAFEMLVEPDTLIELVLVDLDLGGHGIAMIEALSLSAKPPVIAFTELEECYMEPIVRRHGGVGCVSKPIPIQKLAETIEKTIAEYCGCPRCSSDRWGHPRERFDASLLHPAQLETAGGKT